VTPRAVLIACRMACAIPETVPAIKTQIKAVLEVASGLSVRLIKVCSLGCETALIQTGSQPAGPGFESITGTFEGICDMIHSPL